MALQNKTLSQLQFFLGDCRDNTKYEELPNPCVTIKNMVVSDGLTPSKRTCVLKASITVSRLRKLPEGSNYWLQVWQLYTGKNHDDCKKDLGFN